MLQQNHHVQTSGIQSFLESSPDYELAPIGLGSFQDQARKMAEYGRNGDIYVVHAAEGETVIPTEVLDANPKVRELLFGQMREMGLDPQEFIVGNELNSINPVTGLPEFFFKSIFRGIKKVVKKVANVVKKSLPVVLPIAAAAFGVPFLGPAFGAGTFGASFLGSGIGTLIDGGNLKDALKSGLLAGGATLAAQGIGSLFKPNLSFSDALTGSFTGATPVYDGSKLIGTQYAASPYADVFGNTPARVASAKASKKQFANLFSKNPLKAFTGEGQLFDPTPTRQAPGFVPVTQPIASSLNPNAAAIRRGMEVARAAGTPPGSYQVAGHPVPVGPPVSSNVPPAASIGPTPQNLAVMQRTGVNPLTGANVNPLGFTQGQTAVTAGQQIAIDSAAKAAMDAASKDASYFTLGLDNKLLGGPSITAADITKINPALRDAPGAIVKAAAENVNPSLLKQAAVPLALGAGAAYLGGAFDPPEQEEVGREDLAGFVPRTTGAELYAQNPEQYNVAGLNPTQFVPPGTPIIPTTFPALMAANKGGMAEFPRRELLVEGPGTETSDDIPAMLSDGEFVMNARSVRGADPTGRGNRQSGARNLYNMMRNFEMRA